MAGIIGINGLEVKGRRATTDLSITIPGVYAVGSMISELDDYGVLVVLKSDESKYVAQLFFGYSKSKLWFRVKTSNTASGMSGTWHALN